MIKIIQNQLSRWKNYKKTLQNTHPKKAQILIWFETLFGAFCIAMLLRQFIVQSSLVYSGSMIPTLAIDDRLIVNKLVYEFNAPNRGDIVLFDSPYDDGKVHLDCLICQS